MMLLDLQRKMASAVMRPLTADFGMRTATEDGRSMEAEASSFIKPGSRVSSFERLEIYNQQYWFRIMAALAEDFPGLRAVVGEKRFDALSIAYLTANRSASYTLRDLGSRLEEWLRSNPELTGSRHALAIDVVRLEWAYVEAFDNAQGPALTLNDLSALNEKSRLSLQPHVRLLKLEYPVDDFIIAIHRAQPSSTIASNAVSKKKQKKPRGHHDLKQMRPAKTYLAVHRFDNFVYYKNLEPEAFRLLSALAHDASLGDALEEAFENSSIADDRRALHVREWFATASELGWFCIHQLRPQTHQ